MSQKRKRPSEPEDTTAIFRSAPIEDRASRFIGYFSPSLKPEALQKLDEFAEASHKMLAWRRESNQQAITGKTNYVTGHDDDGEKYGGKKVEKVLESMQVTGTCVVARWYGGVMLGPVRFTHIEECAKAAVRQWQETLAEERLKKRKMVEDEREKARLEVLLPERDQSIVVLRKLAAEKEGKVKKAESGGDENNSSRDNDADSTQITSPAKPLPDYGNMPVEKLKILEKARDATLSFLLKRIDEADAALEKLQRHVEEAT